MGVSGNKLMKTKITFVKDAYERQREIAEFSPPVEREQEQSLLIPEFKHFCSVYVLKYESPCY
jgi:hypothetical protein